MEDVYVNSMVSSGRLAEFSVSFTQTTATRIPNGLTLQAEGESMQAEPFPFDHSENLAALCISSRSRLNQGAMRLYNGCSNCLQLGDKSREVRRKHYP